MSTPLFKFVSDQYSTSSKSADGPVLYGASDEIKVLSIFELALQETQRRAGAAAHQSSARQLQG